MPVLKRCTGLNTEENELFRTEGALEVADNVVIDADNTIECRRGFGDFGNALGTSSDVAKQIFTYKNRIIRHFNDKLEFDSNGNGLFSQFNGSYEELESGLRIKSVEMNGNCYITTNSGIKKISAKTASDFSTNAGYITDSGVPKAVSLSAALDFEPGGFLPPQSKVAYRMLWGIRDSNNNLLLGAPSSRYVLTNNTQDLKYPEKFSLVFSSNSTSDYDGTTPNRYITFASKNTQYFIWFYTTTNPNKPVDSETIGRNEIKVDITGLTSSDSIAAVTASTLSTLTAEFSVEVNSSTVEVTSLESGENLEDVLCSAALTSVTANVIDQGDITEGQSANTNVTFTIPSDINKVDYFYQIYRTSIVEAVEGLSLDDVDPGDEMNLVFEANLTSADLLAGEITINDITTEAFRASAVPLYTNPNTGEGILQANDRPPIAKDIALFRNSLFYANTKTVHRKQLNLLSVLNFTSGLSTIVIGNQNSYTTYTFVGETEVFTIDCDTYTNTTANSYILLNSARNERSYYLWFDKGGGTDPALTQKQPIRCNIENLTSASDISAKITETLSSISDFIVVDNGGSVEITLAKNGEATDASFGPGFSGLWNITINTQGVGEDASNNEVLLSSLTSVGQAIEETALSLVNVINKDSNSVVNAYYLSGPNDVPGIILFENRSIEDVNFYIGTEDANLTDRFNPELPVVKNISDISLANPTVITSNSHGLVNGDHIYIYDTNSTPALMGKYQITLIDTNTFSVPVNVTTGGTIGSYFLASVESDNEEAPNRIYFSKIYEPESVPIVNYIDVGPKDQAIVRIVPLRDRLMVFKEDGVYLLTGVAAPNFNVSLLDGSTQIVAPDSAVVLSNKVFCLSNLGIVQVTESGVAIYSKVISNLIKDVVNSKFDYKYKAFGVSYEKDQSYLLWLPTSTSDEYATQCFRYNTDTKTWVRWTVEATCGLVNKFDEKMYLGAADRNYIVQERKMLDRTDYADRELFRSISDNAINNLTITISSANGISEGDALYQLQYVTIAQFNRLLLKLDKDPGLDDSDYYSSLFMSPGDNLTNKLDALNLKLLNDDSSGVVTSRSFSIDFQTIQTQFNDLMAELNNLACDTIFKDYKESEDTVYYETLITSAKISDSTIKIIETTPFVVGNVSVFKGIKCEVRWAPQDFGNPDQLKQIREGSILFDQTNFYSGIVSYASDLSANYEDIPFTLAGSGYWGGNSWGQGNWDGTANEAPVRTLIPLSKQRCRFLRIKFQHINARELFKILGVSLEPRVVSTRGYR